MMLRFVILFPFKCKRSHFYGMRIFIELILAGGSKRGRNSAWENLITK